MSKKTVLNIVRTAICTFAIAGCNKKCNNKPEDAAKPAAEQTAEQHPETATADKEESSEEDTLAHAIADVESGDTEAAN